MAAQIGASLKVERCDPSEFSSWYPSLCENMFGPDPFQAPTVVYRGMREMEMVGFLAGFPLSHQTFYLQYAGVVPAFRGHATLSYLQHGMAAIEQEQPNDSR